MHPKSENQTARHHLFRKVGLAGSLLVAALISSVQGAAIVNLNGDPASSFEGGTASNPAYWEITNTTYNYGSTNLEVGWTSSFNNVTISGSQLTTTGNLRIGSCEGSANNHLTLNNGSQVTAGRLEVGSQINAYETTSSLLISGAGTALTLGDYSLPNTNRRPAPAASLIVEDGGLLKIDGGRRWQPASRPYTATPIYLDGGYYALKLGPNNNPQTLNSGNMTNWSIELFYYKNDEGEWVQTGDDMDAFREHFSITSYETDQAGYEATGQWGLGGFSVITSVPEPSALALLLGSLIFLLPRRRKVRHI